MAEQAQLPPAAVIVSVRVPDFDAWKEIFDSVESSRREHGVLAHHINRAEDDPNHVRVYLALSDVDLAKSYFASPEMKAAMAEAGLTSPPEFIWMKPLRRDAVLDRKLPAMIVTHSVEDVDAWLEKYDAAADLQRANGIIGQAANQSLDDPSMVVVYHQAESFDTLRAFMSMDELRWRMKEAGVTSEPEVSYHTGGWGKQY